MRKVYRGEEIEVSFDLDRCIHIGECLLTLPEVFDLKRRPWIEADGADPDDVADTVLRCPSGARMPHRPTAPDGRKPPTNAIEIVGASRMSSSSTRRNDSVSRVREKIAIAPTEMTRYSQAMRPAVTPKAR